MARRACLLFLENSWHSSALIQSWAASTIFSLSSFPSFGSPRLFVLPFKNLVIRRPYKGPRMKPLPSLLAVPQSEQGNETGPLG